MEWKQRDGPFVSVPCFLNSRNQKHGDGNKRTVPVNSHTIPSIKEEAGPYFPKDQPLLRCFKSYYLNHTVLNQSPFSPQQYACSKDQDAAEDCEKPCAGAAGRRKFITGIIRND